MSRGERSRTMQLDASPEAAVIVEAIRGTLTGNRATLERLFETTRLAAAPSAGRSSSCRATLRLRGQVASVRVSRPRAGAVREVARPARRRRPLGDDDRARRAQPRRRRDAGAAVTAERAAGARGAQRSRVALWLAASRPRSRVAGAHHYVADLSAFLPSAPTPSRRCCSTS